MLLYSDATQRKETRRKEKKKTLPPSEFVILCIFGFFREQAADVCYINDIVIGILKSLITFNFIILLYITFNVLITFHFIKLLLFYTVVRNHALLIVMLAREKNSGRIRLLDHRFCATMITKDRQETCLRRKVDEYIYQS